MEFLVGKRTFGKGKVLIIAEIGTSHGGSAEKACELVDAALASGADVVKFQHVYADEIIHPATGLVPLPGGSIPLYDRFRQLETGPDFLAGIKQRAEAKGAIFLCTPFGQRSARELQAMGVGLMKIASPELNFVQLLDEVCSYGLPTILSSGVSRLADIELAFSRFKGFNAGLALLHCVTAYPAPETDYNLKVLEPLAALFGVPVGVSDHSLDPVLVPALSVAMGSVIVEKHICLSKRDEGLDDPVALEPADFARMVLSIREAEIEKRDATIKKLASLYGTDKVEATLGDGKKNLAPSEQANYERTNRSLHARRAISRGQRIGNNDVAVLRTEKKLMPGLHPLYLPEITGRMAARDIPDGEGINWKDVGAY